MKVVCESCQAKYQVPDERVAGKKLKIRCKRCGATVLIRGDLMQGSAGQTVEGQFSGPAESLAPVETSPQETAGFEWHVSLDGDTRGPFSIDELRVWLNTTASGWDAHVWHEGFPDWVDARACAELDPPQPSQSLEHIASASQVVADMSGLHEELPTQTFQAPQQSAQFFADMSRASQNVQRQASSMRSRPVSGYAEIAPAARAASGVVGRTDESVVFSQPALQTMTSSGVGAPAPAYTPGPNPGFASGEGSGLIDIRALASLARQSTTQVAPGGVPSARQTGQNLRDTGALSFGADDDNRGAPGAIGRIDSLAPVVTTATSNAALPLAILGGCALVAAAVLAAVLFNRPARSAEVVSGQSRESIAAATQPPNSAEPAISPKSPPEPSEPLRNIEADADQRGGLAMMARGDTAMRELSEGEGDSDELASAKAKRQQRLPHTAVEEKKPGATPEEKSKPKKEEKPEQLPDSPDVMLAERAKPIKQAPLPPAPEAAPNPAAPKSSGTDIDSLLAAKPAGKPGQKPSSMDDLMSGAVPKGPTPTPAPPVAVVTAEPVADLPDSPSRDETLAAMHGVEAAVRGCGGSEPITGTAEVSISVAGTTGRVTSATVTGITGNVGSCIARAVRAARFPRFNKPTFSIKYPYRF
jgi:predicted Zn finger-like uncharacterized protein